MALFVAFLLALCILPMGAYFSATSFNSLPMQLAISSFVLYYIYGFKFDKLRGFLFAACTLLLLSRLSLADLATSPITASFLTIALVSGLARARKSDPFITKVGFRFCALMIVFSTYLNFTFSGEGIEGARSKGFGSGTIYSLIAAYCIILLFIHYRNRRIANLRFYAMSAVFAWTLILTQSRGALLTTVPILVMISMAGTSRKRWGRMLLMATAVVILFAYTPIASRFINLQGNDFAKFSSGRSTTHLLILADAADMSQPSVLFFGHGFNSLKDKVNELGIEFPHFDALFLLYEGGLFLVALFTFMLLMAFPKFKSKAFFWAFMLSSLHTNMILSPGFFLLSKVLDSASSGGDRKALKQPRP